MRDGDTIPTFPLDMYFSRQTWFLCTKENKIFIARFIEEIFKSDDIIVESEFSNFVDDWQKDSLFFVILFPLILVSQYHLFYGSRRFHEKTVKNYIHFFRYVTHI